MESIIFDEDEVIVLKYGDKKIQVPMKNLFKMAEENILLKRENVQLKKERDKWKREFEKMHYIYFYC